MLGVVVHELAFRGRGGRSEAGQVLWLSLDLREQRIRVDDLQLLFKEPFEFPVRHGNLRVGL